MNRVKQFLAAIGRIIGLKKAKSEHDTDVDIKDNTKVESKADPRTRYHDFATQTPPDPKPLKPRPRKKGWTFRREDEFPWRFEQAVDHEENWRGTWVLEVKDMRAMDWGTELVPKADPESICPFWD
ncbi:hypothetical protein CNYM01_00707 [Colletotrichum nymphaeae SA-01]|uniref:Uncharacterized protein n=1 Tax=Colletotrichum nymphaeae SA-01 TaxID=1460502 RepID=A0A135TFA2_9PEZI|nr:hypothetical protein CNYM01_00707 [Colletotrichum nymphaeae SA-01]